MRNLQRSKMFKYLTIIISFSTLLAIDANFSLETKYGDGSKITGQASLDPDTTDYNFLENILDVNLAFDNGIFISTQLEYSDPPVFGTSVKGFNNVYLDYYGDDYSVKLGSIYSLYGRGLSINMSQNQNIDFDNSVNGIELKYNFDNLSFSGLYGKSQFHYRSNPAFIETDLFLDNEILFTGVEYFSDNLGIFSASFLKENSVILIECIEKYYNGNSEIGNEISDRIPAEVIDETESADIVSNDFNLSWNAQLFGIDFYIERVWNRFNKILSDEKDDASKFYFSSYFDISGFGITYEYKNYDQKYYIQTVANAPIGFRESSSTLASRNNHSINWGDEVGHQIEVNKSISNKLQWLANLSISRKHEVDGNSAISIGDILSMDVEDEVYHQYPFKQFYTEIAGYVLSDKLYFKLGYDNFAEFKGYENVPHNTIAITYPSMFTFDFGNGNSITSYIEYQNREQEVRNSDLSELRKDFYKNNYLSFTYNYKNFLSFSFFYEDEEFDKTILDSYQCHRTSLLYEDEEFDKTILAETWDDGINVWRGYDISAKLNATSQLSLFYGSQKGGLVCANGVCAEQPGFDNGVKATFRTIF